MSTAVQETTQKKDKSTSIVKRMAESHGVDANQFWKVVKSTAFRDNSASNEEMMTFMMLAEKEGLSPFNGEIHAFKDERKGVIPIIGIDGWSKKINSHPQFDGMEFEYDREEEAMTCRMYRKDRSRPISVTEYLEECRRNTGPWKSHPRRMLRHKAMIQAARMAFGFAGYDEDEAERIKESSGSEAKQSQTSPREEYRNELVEEIRALLEANLPDEVTWFEDNAGKMFKTVESLEAYRDQLYERIESQMEQDAQAQEAAESEEEDPAQLGVF